MNQLTSHVYTFIGDMRRSFLDLAIIVIVIAFFQFVVIRTTPENLPNMIIGLVIVGIGLALFMRGLELGVFPLGENLATQLASSKSKFWIIVFAFVIGFSTTIAEPALIAIANKAAFISAGHIDALILRLVVAGSVGLAIVLGVIRIFLNHPIHWYIISGYALVLAVTYFAPPEIVGLAYDSGGVTTSTVTVPLIAALGIGLASSLKNRNPIIDGFGLIAFASLTPMIFVQLYGIFAYSVGASTAVAPSVSLLTQGTLGVQTASAFVASSALWEYFAQFAATIIDVTPIILTLLFFYIVVVRKPVENLGTRVFGFILVILGLYAFVVGLELGLFPIGESIATSLALKGNLPLIYLFAFTIGFATTLAEPALTAIANKAETISGGSIRSLALRLFVAVGVGVGILLGAYRIVHGDSLVWYIISGYAVVVLFTFFAPKTIIPIAYDSGGVTTSTITVPIVAALGLGLASTIPGRDPLIDGFGLIAFASLFPMIAVLSYGIFETQNIRRHERRITRLSSKTADRVLRRLQGDGALSESKTKKEIITITGMPGAGVSSVARRIAEKMRYQYFSSGDIFRIVADRHGVTVEEMNSIAENQPQIDQEVDQIIRDLGVTESKIVIDSRLGYHWIHNSFKVYLQVDEGVGSERMHNADAELHGECDHTSEEVLTASKQRMESKRERYQKLYGIDILNTKPFNITIDTTDNTVEKTAKAVSDAYKGWLDK